MKNLFIMIICLFALTYSSFSQKEKSIDEKEKKQEVLDFKIAPKFLTNVYYKYILTDTTTVSRIFKTGDTIRFQRYITYYYTIEAPAMPENGFITLSVSLDSLSYDYSDGNKKVHYYTQDDEGVPPYNLKDFTQISCPNGLNFDITYSPYFEVAKIDGENLIDRRQYISSPETGIRDSIQKFIWFKGLSDDFLSSFADPLKNILPINRVAIDSSWVKPYKFYINNVLYIDTAITTLKDFDTKTFTMIADLKNLKTEEKQILTFGIEDFVNVDSATLGKGQIKVELTARGVIQSTEINTKINQVLSYKNQKFNQIVDTKLKYFLEKMVRFK